MTEEQKQELHELFKLWEAGAIHDMVDSLNGSDSNGKTVIEQADNTNVK